MKTMHSLETVIQPDYLQQARDKFLRCIRDGLIGDAVKAVPGSAIQNQEDGQYFIGMLAQSIQRLQFPPPKKWPGHRLTNVEFFITFALTNRLEAANNCGMDAWREKPQTFFRDLALALAFVEEEKRSSSKHDTVHVEENRSGTLPLQEIDSFTQRFAKRVRMALMAAAGILIAAEVSHMHTSRNDTTIPAVRKSSPLPPVSPEYYSERNSPASDDASKGDLEEVTAQSEQADSQ